MTVDAQVLQFVAWGVALLELILGLYVLLLNVGGQANRRVAGVLILFAVSDFALGMLSGATGFPQALWASQLVAATAPAVQAGILVVIMTLLRPRRYGGYWRMGEWLVAAVGVLPAVLVVIDVVAGTQFWYTGLDETSYVKGYVPLFTYAQGSLSSAIRMVNFVVMGVLGIVVALAFSWRGDANARRLARLLLGIQVTAVVLEVAFGRVLPAGVSSVLSGLIFSVGYAYAAFTQMLPGQGWRWGRLRSRLVTLVLAIVFPPLVVVPAVLVPSLFGEHVRHDLDDRLASANRALASNTSLLMRLNIEILRQIVMLPDIVSMDPARQKPVLEAVVLAHPHIYLACTTDLNGFNVARSDDRPLLDYSDRLWFRAARDGSPVTIQTLVSRTTGEPAVVVSMPVKDQDGLIVGVALIGSDLMYLSREVATGRMGRTGVVYVVDRGGLVVAHPDMAIAASLHDYSQYPPVVALRAGQRGLLSFNDDEGRRWRAFVDVEEHGWGIIAQQEEEEVVGAFRQLVVKVWLAVLGGAVVVGVLIVLAVGQSLRPLERLTEGAIAVAAGELERVPLVEGEGESEVGVLARAFNRLSGRLHRLAVESERQVAERMAALKRRAGYLEAAALVARDAAMEMELQQVLDRAAALIAEHLGFYHVGIFLLDEEREWAVLQAACGEGGRRMLAREHRLRVGEEGIVGYVIASGEPRVAYEVGDDEVHHYNPDLAGTRSEVALPLRVRGQVIGALDVQSEEPSAFSEEDMAVLQMLADQVALAIGYADLLYRLREGVREKGRPYGELGRQVWRALSVKGYTCDDRGVVALEDVAVVPAGDELTLTLPIAVRGQVVGRIVAQKPGEAGAWTEDERAVLQTLVERLGVALESARLYQDVQRRAAREQLTREITDRLRAALDVDALLQMVIREAATAVGASRAFVQWVALPDEAGEGEANGKLAG